MEIAMQERVHLSGRTRIVKLGEDQTSISNSGEGWSLVIYQEHCWIHVCTMPVPVGAI
jgi:hypothetical protein